MNKKLLEMLNAISEKKAEVKNLVDSEKLEEAKTAKAELEDMQAKFDILKDVLDAEPVVIEDKVVTGEVKPVNPVVDSVKAFADAARTGFKNAMNEGTGEDGGYTVPVDILTKIEERRTAKASLIELVDTESVSTNKGSRTFKKRSQQTGFAKVGEGGKIGAKATPQFERLDYEIAKYAGYFPMTNELLEDSDVAITDTLVSWIGDESRVTRNKIILDQINKKATTALTGLDDIKKAINVTLGQAFKATAKIITNDDGLQYLDTLKDTNGRDLLQPNPTEPANLQLRAGATVIPIVVLPNEDMPSEGTSVPFVIGDLKEAVKFFDRKQLNIMTSNSAAVGDLNAFEEDLTLFRAIEREDCKVKDENAFVNGRITVGE